MHPRLIVLFTLLAVRSGAELDVPESITRTLNDQEFNSKYELRNDINPFYLRGDFDGDGKPDYIFLIRQKTTGHRGAAIQLSSRKTGPKVIGADRSFIYGGQAADDLNFDIWHVLDSKRVPSFPGAGPAPVLRGEGIVLGVREAASGVIYWNGREFSWYQLSD